MKFTKLQSNEAIGALSNVRFVKNIYFDLSSCYYYVWTKALDLLTVGHYWKFNYKSKLYF